MRNTLPRFTIIAATGLLTVCLSAASAVAQITQRPVAPAAPAAPVAPARPTKPDKPLLPDGLDVLEAPDAPVIAEEWLQDAKLVALSAVDRVREVDLDRVLDRIDTDVAPRLAMLDARLMDPQFVEAPFARLSLPESPRAAWAQGDPADSLYRLARQSLNAGEYRRAAQMFAQISRQYPTSQYRSDAVYWRAFSLYRIGDIADLHEALQALDSAGTLGSNNATSSPSGRRALSAVAEGWSKGTTLHTTTFNVDLGRSLDAEGAVLATRIRGALAARGDASAAAQIARTADASGPSCDEEDAQLRVEALNALVQMDPSNANPAITKVLARRDSCSAPLRRGALGLIARTNDAHSTELLINTAKSDPSLEVQAEAIRLLGRTPDDHATAALVEVATSSGKPPLQRIAVRSLAAQQSAAARQAIRNLMTRADLPPDVRITALHYAGKTDLQVGDLVKMYDASADRSTREEIIHLLEQRDEPQAADKLIDIARTSTDPAMRRLAISALSRKKDPRTTKLLMDILDK